MTTPKQPKVNTSLNCNRTVQDKVRDFDTSKDFGGKSDGITDDTAAINLGISTLSALGKKAILIIPKNTIYNVSALVTNTRVALIDLSSDGVIKYIFHDEGMGATTKGGMVLKTVGSDGILMRVQDNGIDGDPYLDFLNEITGLLASISFDKARLTGFMDITEALSPPNPPGANRARFFARDNGAGKTQLCVRFNTGAVQVIATEP